MKKTETFEELVKKQEQEEEISLTTNIAFVIGSGIAASLVSLYTPSNLNWLAATIGYSLCGIGLFLLILKIIKWNKPAEIRLYREILQEDLLNSDIKYCLKNQTNSILIRSDYMKSYYLEIMDVKDFEQTLKTLSNLPKDMITKNILNRVEPGDCTIADILDTSVCIMRYGSDNYFKDKFWKVLINETQCVVESDEKDTEINRYLPKNEKLEIQ